MRRALGEANHIRAIDIRIAGIKREIGEEQKRPVPDFLRLSKLKRQKIHLKDTVRRVLCAETNPQVQRSVQPAHLAYVDARND
tara:strand:- start:22305 stop:22553 length:249 start_codon:yes stop_codon:yes gene_type:complete